MGFDEKLLEFQSVRDLVSVCAISSLGRARVDAMRPMARTDELLPAIVLVKEMMALLASRQEPPIQGLRDVTLHLSKVRRDRSVLEPQELLELKDFMETAAHTRKFFEPLQPDYPRLHALAMPLQALPALRRSIDEKIAPNSTVRDSASELLARLRADIASSETSIQRDLARMVRELTTAGDLQDDFFTLRNDRYVLPVKTSNRGKVPGIIHDSSNSGETVFIEPFAILEQTNRLADLRLREREEVFRILLKVAGHVRDELNGLLTDLEVLGEFDFVFAKARFGTVHHGRFPTLTEFDHPIGFVSAHHPLLYAASPAASRPLNLALDVADRALVITGPNAGGKTTALKTIGLTVLMIQSALPAPLDSRSHMPVFNDVLANIGDEQSILEGQSTFSAQVKRIAQILNQSGAQSLVLLDELGTATDPGEGGALAVAILEHLSDRGALTVVSSHLGALKTWAHSHPNGRNASFRLSEQDHKPTFRLVLDMIGISEALVVAEQVGLPPEVIARARALQPQGEGDATALLLSMREKEQQLAEELQEAGRVRVDLEDKQRALERQMSDVKDEKRKMRRKLLEEHEQALAELRAKVESLLARQPSKQELAAAKKELADAQQENTQLQESLDSVSMAAARGLRLEDLAVGARVEVLSMRDTGTVEHIDLNKQRVRVALGKLTITVGLPDLAVAQALEVKPGEQSYKAVHYRRPELSSSTIDLHGNRVDEALSRTDKFLDQALASGYSSVKLMHGQGSGALRRALHEFLRTHPVVRQYRYALPEEGGGGVTIVEFK